MSKIVLSAECIDTGIDTLKSDKANDKKWLRFSDMLRGQGVTSEALTADKELRDQIKKQIILPSFTKAEQAIAAKPRTALSDEEKITARYVTTETGTKLGKIIRHVRKAEQDETMTDEERGARKVADLATRLKKDLTYWIEKIEKAEAVTFSATQMIKHLKDASALIK